MSIDTALSEFTATWYYKVPFHRDNPNLAPLVDAYLAGGARPTDAQLGTNHYARGLVLLEDMRRPSAAPLFDGRASRLTQLWGWRSSSDQGGQSPHVWDGLPFYDGDITLQDDPRFGRVYRTRLNAASRNPYWTGQPADKPSCEITCNGRPISMGQVDWYAFSIQVQPGWRAGSWGVVAQLGYPTLTSPPIAVAISTAGVGIDRHAGVLTTAGSNAGLLNEEPRWLTLAECEGVWVDFLVGVCWRVDATGWVHVETRKTGESWKVGYDKTNTPTFQQLSGQPVKTSANDKQGAYQQITSSFPTGWENVLLHSGLTRWASEDDARRSLG